MNEIENLQDRIRVNVGFILTLQFGNIFYNKMQKSEKIEPKHLNSVLEWHQKISKEIEKWNIAKFDCIKKYANYDSKNEIVRLPNGNYDIPTDRMPKYNADMDEICKNKITLKTEKILFSKIASVGFSIVEYSFFKDFIINDIK